MLVKKYFVTLCFCCTLSLCAEEAPDCSAVTPLQKIDFDTAVYRTLTQSLPLYIANDETKIQRHQVAQARLSPNPAFSYEVEDVGGNRGGRRGWNNREEYYIWTQLFETGGKRELRTQAACYQYYASLVGYDVSKIIILNRLNRAFINVVAAQELLKLTEDQLCSSKNVLDLATKKVEAGKVSVIHQSKADVAYSKNLIELEKIRVELKNAKRRLSLLWSSPCPDFDAVVFPFFDICPPNPLEQCLADLCNQPEIMKSVYDQLNAQKNYHLEKARRIPDVTVSLGYKSEHDDNRQGIVAGISIPIPLFDRNQGNIGSAFYDMIKTGDQGKQLWVILQSKLAITYDELLQAYHEAEKIKNVSLPMAEQAYKLLEIGYREGKYEYLDVLDAQRTLYDLREDYIQALVNYHNRRADIDYLNSQTD